jgi:MFS family permease
LTVEFPTLKGHGTFSSLAVRNYRLFFIGQLVSVTGTWMQTVAQAFLVLQLTNSGTVLGLTIAARFAPLFLFGQWGGLVADRVNKRLVLYFTQGMSGLLALALGLLVTTRLIELWMVYLLVAMLGLVNIFDLPARQTFISELVPTAQLRNAVTLNSVTVNMARIFGGALAGLIVATLGLALCFELNALSFAAVLITLALMSRSEIRASKPQQRERGQIRAGLRYVASSPDLLIPLVMIGVIGALAWEFQISLPLLAKNTFHGGAGTYGAMASVMGAGAVLGGLVSASRSHIPLTGLAVAAVGWGVAITAAALAPSLLVEYVMLIFVGYGSVTFNSLAKSALQLTSPPHMRGRVMALWALAWQGSTPIGGPIIGWISEQFGARWSLLAGGIPTVAVGLIAFPLLSRVRQRQIGLAAPADELVVDGGEFT